MFRVGYYLSSDAIINVNDRLIGTCSFASGLLAGQSGTCAASSTIPANVTAGTYYLGAIVDDGFTVVESEEANNASVANSGALVIAPMALQTPVCTLTASPAAISAGASTTLFASCSPAATSYTWANIGFATVAGAGVVSPAVTTSYAVTGNNAAGSGNRANVTVSVAAAAAANYADLWWAGDSENGWGLSIHQHGNNLFTALHDQRHHRAKIHSAPGVW